MVPTEFFFPWVSPACGRVTRRRTKHGDVVIKPNATSVQVTDVLLRSGRYQVPADATPYFTVLQMSIGNRKSLFCHLC